MNFANHVSEDNESMPSGIRQEQQRKFHHTEWLQFQAYELFPSELFVSCIFRPQWVYRNTNDRKQSIALMGAAIIINIQNKGGLEQTLNMAAGLKKKKRGRQQETQRTDPCGIKWKFWTWAWGIIIISVVLIRNSRVALQRKWFWANFLKWIRLCCGGSFRVSGTLKLMTHIYKVLMKS